MRIIPLTLRAANDFVERWHRHSARTNNDGGKFAIGLEVDGELVGVAIVGRPTAIGLQHKPGGATLRGAGAGEPVEIAGGRQWDCPSRPRKRRDLYEEPKFRWDEALPEVPA